MSSSGQVGAMAKTYEELGEVATPVSVASIKAGMEEALAKAAGITGASPALSPQVKLSDKTIAVGADGKNTQPVTAELEVPKLTPGEMQPEDETGKVKSTVNNDKLGTMLKASGHADMAANLRDLDQAMKLDNAGGKEGPNGRMEQDPRLANRMNMLHRQASRIFGLDQQPQPGAKSQKLEDFNGMKQDQLAARIQYARDNNPALVNKSDPKELNALNAKKLADRDAALKNKANVEKITIGAIGLNFQHDRKNTIEKSSEFAPQHKAQDPQSSVSQRSPVGRPPYRQALSPSPEAAARLTNDGGEPAPAQSGLDVIVDTVEHAAIPANNIVNGPKLTPASAKMAQLPPTAPSGPYQRGGY